MKASSSARKPRSPIRLRKSDSAVLEVNIMEDKLKKQSEPKEVHMDCECNDCGYDFDYSYIGDLDQAEVERRISDIRCPNCGCGDIITYDAYAEADESLINGSTGLSFSEALSKLNNLYRSRESKNS